MITIHKQLHSPDLKVIHAWIKVKQGQEKEKILDWFIFPHIVQSVWSVRDLNWDAVPFFYTVTKMEMRFTWLQRNIQFYQE